MLYDKFSGPYLSIDLRRNCVAFTENWRYENSFLVKIINTAFAKTTRFCHCLNQFKNNMALQVLCYSDLSESHLESIYRKSTRPFLNF